MDLSDFPLDDGIYKEEVTLSENEMHMVNVLSCPLTGQFIAEGETVSCLLIVAIHPITNHTFYFT